MASPTETIYWPVGAGMAFIFILAIFLILGQVQNQVEFHTANEIADVSSHSFLYSHLNTRGTQSGKEFSTYEMISYDRCGKNHPVDYLFFSTFNYDREYVKWLKVTEDIPSQCGGGENTNEYGQRGKDGTFKHKVKIPTRGGGVIDLELEYEPRY